MDIHSPRGRTGSFNPRRNRWGMSRHGASVVAVTLLATLVLPAAGASVSGDCWSGGDAGDDMAYASDATPLTLPIRCFGHLERDDSDVYSFTVDGSLPLHFIVRAPDSIGVDFCYAPPSWDIGTDDWMRCPPLWGDPQQDAVTIDAPEAGTWHLAVMLIIGDPTDYSVQIDQHRETHTGTLALGAPRKTPDPHPLLSWNKEVASAPAIDAATIAMPVTGTGNESAELYFTSLAGAWANLQFFDAAGAWIATCDNAPQTILASGNRFQDCQIPAGTATLVIQASNGAGIDYRLEIYY